MSTPASIEESLRRRRRFRLTSRAREAAAARAGHEGGANSSQWEDVLLLSSLAAMTAVLTLCNGYAAITRSHPTDDELTVRFLSHESDFQSLLQILESDRIRLRSLGAESYEFAEFVRTGVDSAQLADCEVLLAKIGAANFRYFPRSGNLSVPASRSLNNSAETSRSYLYLNLEEPSSGKPQPLRRYQGGSFWRGPGVHFVVGDRRIKGRWFIHHEGTEVVAFAPY